MISLKQALRGVGSQLVEVTSDLAGQPVVEQFLIEHSIQHEGTKPTIYHQLAAYTGQHTGRNVEAKQISYDRLTRDKIDWQSPYNHPIDRRSVLRIYERMVGHVANKPMFHQTLYVGGHSSYQLRVEVATELAWHALFANRLLRRQPLGQPSGHQHWSVLVVPSFKPDPKRDGTRLEDACVIIDFSRRLVLIGGTAYAGEIKKALFTVLNFILTEMNELSMHCSYNLSDQGDQGSIMFGLSGTGKSTHGLDPSRRLVGDDEHGWTNDQGVANHEGGAYAKVINFNAASEPAIDRALRQPDGPVTILENVPLIELPDGRYLPDYQDSSLTENTRAAFVLEGIANLHAQDCPRHPETVIFLTADATGVIPPISRLTRQQIRQWFLWGYTSKVSGTEIGVTEPVVTLSPCFGSPFLTHHPKRYADLLMERIDRHAVGGYLVNTGWVTGPYDGQRPRISIEQSRAMIRMAQNGGFEHVPCEVFGPFNLQIPQVIPGSASIETNPLMLWGDPDRYHDGAQRLYRKLKEEGITA